MPTSHYLDVQALDLMAKWKDGGVFRLTIVGPRGRILQIVDIWTINQNTDENKSMDRLLN